ncbi:MAG: hypothetical protein ACSLE8_06265 [Rhodococcus sp. (in: high G+C Gram-positive bacteria)]
MKGHQDPYEDRRIGEKRRAEPQIEPDDQWKFIRESNGYAIQEKDGKFRTVPVWDKHVKA